MDDSSTQEFVQYGFHTAGSLDKYVCVMIDKYGTWNKQAAHFINNIFINITALKLHCVCDYAPWFCPFLLPLPPLSNIPLPTYIHNPLLFSVINNYKTIFFKLVLQLQQTRIPLFPSSPFNVFKQWFI